MLFKRLKNIITTYTWNGTSDCLVIIIEILRFLLFERVILVRAPRRDIQRFISEFEVKPAFPSELTHYYLTLG